MENIPLHTLESFERFYVEHKSRIPARHIEQVKNRAMAYFSVFQRDEHPCKAEVDIHRSEFYKILLVTGGSGYLVYGTKKYVIQPGDLLFLKPTQVRSWKTTTTDQQGYYCIFSEQFYAMVESHLKELRNGPHFAPGACPVLSLNQAQLKIILHLFEKLYYEFNGDYNTEIIKMYLHILLLESAKVRGQIKDTIKDTSAPYLLTQRFLELLEKEYATHDKNEGPELKFPSDFANELSVHTNHLNALVKMVTGQTVREHIHNRMLVEAQLLLTHTRLNVSEVAYKLGFKEPTHFTSFFRKHLNTTPVDYKRVSLA